jgi:predicted nucleotidyltransferase
MGDVKQRTISGIVRWQATFDNFKQLVYFLEELFGRKADLLTVAGIDKYIRQKVEHEVIRVKG